MLPVETQHRIYDVIPRSLDLEWHKPVHGEDPDPVHTETVELTVREQEQDTPPRDHYPLALVSFGPTSVNWESGNSLSESRKTEPVPGDDTVAYREYIGEDMYDVLNVVLSVADGEGAMPRDVVAKKLAQEVYAALLLDVDHLNDPATIPSENDYIWPVNIEQTTGNGITPLPPEGGEFPTKKYAMQFECHYTFTEIRDVPATDRIEYEARTRHVDDVTTSESGSVDL